MKFLINVHKTAHGKVITICDLELYGSILKDEDITFEVNEFYGGREFSREEIDSSIFTEASCIHVVGRNSLNLLKELKVIKEDDLKFVRYIQGVPVLIIFNVQKILR